MSSVTVEQVLRQARQLTWQEQQRLARLLEGGERTDMNGARPDPSVADPFADDPVMAEWREAMKRAEEALGLHSTEEIMSHLRRRPWRFDG